MKKTSFRLIADRVQSDNLCPRKIGLAVVASAILVSFLFALTVAPANANSRTNLPSSKSEAIAAAKKLIDKDDANSADLQSAILMLTRYASPAADEIAVPLLLAEANYCLADPSADIKQEFTHYEKAGRHAERALEIDPRSAEAHYWHGLYQLKKAQKVGGMRAFFIAKAGVKELEGVRRSLPGYDHGGASRVLALMYYIAPAWTSFGDLDKSIQLATEATRIDPDYMLNRLYLANAYKKRGDKEEAIREYRVIQANSPNVPGREGEFYRQAKQSLASLQGS